MPARYAKLGSISSDTHRSSDLIRRFTDALQILDNSVAERIMSEYPLFYAHSPTDNIVLPPEYETETIKYFSARLYREECNHLVFFGDGRVTFGILSEKGLRQPPDRDEIWDSSDAGGIVDALMGELDRFSPPYCYFGASDGDGSDFGFWPSMQDIEQAFEGERLCKMDPSWDWKVEPLGEDDYVVSVTWPDSLEFQIPEGWTAEKNATGHTTGIHKTFHDLDGVVEINERGNTTFFNLEGQEIWSF